MRPFPQARELTIAVILLLLPCMVMLPTTYCKDAVPPEGVDLSGYYTIKGKDVSGKHYSGIVSLKSIGDIYVVTWVMGTESNQGVGIRIKERLSVSWTQDRGGKVVKGVSVYRIDDQKKYLSGWWASMPGDGKLHEESWSWLKAFDKEEDD